MLENIYKNQKESSIKAIEALKRDFMTLRTGKVNINILDNVFVEYYGNQTPLNQVATVLATDAMTITITPWEKTMIKPIDTAIKAANIGVTPNSDAEGIKLYFPPMTTEQREENVKRAKAMGEKAKVSIRNIRKEANDEIKKSEKELNLSEDDVKKAYDDVQKITDEFTSKVDSEVKNKEVELLKV